MKKGRLVVANWKMNPPTVAEAKKLFLRVKKRASTVSGVQTIICPPTVFLAEIRKLYVGKKIAFGGQDVSGDATGAHTGEISAAMLRSVGASYVIVGHSERRSRGESHKDVAKKVRAALDERLTVILCIGEEVRDRDGAYLQFVTEELTSALAHVERQELKHVVVVYEPVWAIGRTYEDAMKPADMHEMSLFIRKILTEEYERESAMGVSILYGGSVEPENSETLLADGAIDGFLVGHASRDAASFTAILEGAHGRGR